MKRQGKTGFWKQTLLCGGETVLLAAVLSSAAAFLIGREILPENAENTAVMGILIAAGFFGILFGIRNSERIGSAALGVGLFFALLTAGKMLLFPGEALYLPRNAVCIAAGGAAAMLLHGRKRKNPLRRKGKRR